MELCSVCEKDPLLCGEEKTVHGMDCPGWVQAKPEKIQPCKTCKFVSVSFDKPPCNQCRDQNGWLRMSSKTAPKNNIQEGKPKMSLLPMDVLAKYLVPAYEEGIVKYSRESWRKGFLVSDMTDAAIRHIGEFFWENADIDSGSSSNKHHLAGAIFSLLCILQTLDRHPELDDRNQNTGLNQNKTEDK